MMTKNGTPTGLRGCGFVGDVSCVHDVAYAGDGLAVIPPPRPELPLER